MNFYSNSFTNKSNVRFLKVDFYLEFNYTTSSIIAYNVQYSIFVNSLIIYVCLCVSSESEEILNMLFKYLSETGIEFKC